MPPQRQKALMSCHAQCPQASCWLVRGVIPCGLPPATKNGTRGSRIALAFIHALSDRKHRGPATLGAHRFPVGSQEGSIPMEASFSPDSQYVLSGAAVRWFIIGTVWLSFGPVKLGRAWRLSSSSEWVGPVTRDRSLSFRCQPRTPRFAFGRS